MVFAIASNIVVNLAWWSGISLTALSIFVIIFMIFWRHWVETSKKRNQILAVERERILYDSIQSEDEKYLEFWSLKNSKEMESTFGFWKQKSISSGSVSRPKLLKKILNYNPSEFLFLWNYLHESVRGNSKEKLNTIARSIDLKESAIKMLDSHLLKNRLLAIGTFGNLKDETATFELIKLSNHHDPIISFWATRALLRINFEKNTERFLPLIGKRMDWSPILVAEMLKERGADEISMSLVNLVENAFAEKASERQIARLISYLSIAHPTDYTPIIIKILAETSYKEVIIACLKLVLTEDALPLVREFFKDERWQVRMQVVLTLGRIGHSKDIKFLIKALNDLDWWVRYRAACALISMPGMTEKRLLKLSNSLPNQFSRDILKHVLAEIRLKCFLQPLSFTLSK